MRYQAPCQVPCRIAIVGDAPGREEEKAGIPFVGSGGQLLNSLLSQADIVREDCLLTTVFTERPANNSLASFGTTKIQAKKKYKEILDVLKQQYADFDWPDTYEWPAITGNQCVEPSRLGCLSRLQKELGHYKPKLIVAAGSAACWALLGETSIGKLRGVVAWSDFAQCKVIPIYHPTAIMRQYSLLSTTVLDLRKAERESYFREIRKPRFEIWIEPTIGDLQDFFKANIENAESISIDIETYKGQISCVGFGCLCPDEITRSIVIPFIDRRKGNNSYWTHEDELEAWKFVRNVCDLPCPKELQNGMYDVQYLWKYNCPVRNLTRDTMLLHHAMQPELPKGLGYLASIYTNFPSWKDMRPSGRDFELLKKEE